MLLDVVQTLQQLVAIPSVNPMGREFSGDEYLEHAVTNHLQGLFEQLGLAWERSELEPRRENIVARLDGERDPMEGGSLLVFEAHQDTVPVDGMVIPAWTPEIRDERVYGRGSCDIKGGMACMLATIARLAEERPQGLPTIIMACSVNEEHGFTGAVELAEQFSSGKSSLVPRTPDAVIVAEPTQLDVVVAHKGTVRWKCRTQGTACHSSVPHLGDNAIYRMARVLAVIEEAARANIPQLGQHPLVGQPTISVGTIGGGISVNTVPDECTIEIDRRLLPGEDPAEARQQIIDQIAAATGFREQIVHEPPYIAAPGLSEARNASLAESLAAAAGRCGNSANLVGVPYGTDAPAFDQIGSPTVVFGPGSIDQAHTCDEWIEIDQLRRATEIYYEFAKGFTPTAIES